MRIYKLLLLFNDIQRKNGTPYYNNINVHPQHLSIVIKFKLLF